MKTYNKGGRPTKSLVEKRKYRVNLKMNTEEYYMLKNRASEAGVSPCDFIRSVIPKAEIRQRLSPEWMEHIRKISGMANNLNQIARKINSGQWSGHDRVHVVAALMAIGRELSELRDEVRKQGERDDS